MPQADPSSVAERAARPRPSATPAQAPQPLGAAPRESLGLRVLTAAGLVG